MSEKGIHINWLVLSKKTKKAIYFALIFLVVFGMGSMITYFTMRSNFIGPHKDLVSINYYCRTIINSFEANVYSTSDLQTFYCKYEYNTFSNFTFNPINGNVDYEDDYYSNPEYEIITLSFDNPGYYFEDIILHVNFKIRLSLIIFADDEIIYVSNKLKNDLELSFTPTVELIELYFF